MKLTRIVENILFASSTPCTLARLCSLSGASSKDVTDALRALNDELASERGGLILIENGETYTLGTNPEVAPIITRLQKEEPLGELSRPALETLAVIAYRGPVTKPEIEEIRGVNCAVSLRNLLIAGLIQQGDQTSDEQTYAISMEFLRHLGAPSLDKLPDYNRLHEMLISSNRDAGEKLTTLDI
ncbi:MAG: SMC-Scp complex subunit ScpB [bacterium]|nr:SMC-Scp complex subunit ScpB [bacterium]